MVCVSVSLQSTDMRRRRASKHWECALTWRIRAHTPTVKLVHRISARPRQRAEAVRQLLCFAGVGVVIETYDGRFPTQLHIDIRRHAGWRFNNQHSWFRLQGKKMDALGSSLTKAASFHTTPLLVLSRALCVDWRSVCTSGKTFCSV